MRLADILPVLLSLLAATVVVWFAAWLVHKREDSHPPPRMRAAHARVEQNGDGVTVVLPPHPGVRRAALIWTLLPTLLVAYVCVIIDASPMGWALFAGSAFAMAAAAASQHREISTSYYDIRTDGTWRAAHTLFRREGQLSPPKQRGALGVCSDKSGSWYFRDEGRPEDHVWGHISRQDAKRLRGLGVPDDSSAPPNLPHWSLSSWLYVFSGFLFLATFAYPIFSPLGRLEGLPHPRLEGSFRADHEALGSWQLTPLRCLSGRERGFEGVVFQFSAASPVRELRIDMERPGDAVLEFHFFEPNRQPLRIAQRECERIDGHTDARVVVINGRDMDVLKGNVSIACARFGLVGQASYEGCLP